MATSQSLAHDHPTGASAPGDFGALLRGWRLRRRHSQLSLALHADLSARHLSFVETGRAQPSRELVLRLAERLDVPPRERDALLLAAGYAPTPRVRTLDDAALQAVRRAVDTLLWAFEPSPALAVDRHWTMLAFNAVVPKLLAGVCPALLEPPVNVLRLSLHPKGLAPRIANLGEWKRHLVERLKDQFAASADPVLAELADELSGYPAPPARDPAECTGAVFVPLMLDTPAGQLRFLSTVTVFGSPVDVTLSEIAVEAFFPADEVTAKALHGS